MEKWGTLPMPVKHQNFGCCEVVVDGTLFPVQLQLAQGNGGLLGLQGSCCCCVV